MPGALPQLKLGPVSYQVSGLVTGGQLVVATGSTHTGPPSAGSAQTVMACTTANISSLASGFTGVLGIAGTDANVLTQPEFPSNNTSEYPTGYDQVLDISYLQDYVAVYMLGEFIVLFEASASFGQALVAGVAGGVTPFVSGTHTADAIIARCTQPGGVTSSGSTTGSAFINVC